ncbi:MAG TPA: STAS domain-containing protein [Solirubrobacteraceae bacterium]|jgi:stage II sporulation protein AA (anti-sigma F factor antagonist)|nr:STAS domain-containing protein [Solirubrobacteraceae bacterium]
MAVPEGSREAVAATDVQAPGLRVALRAQGTTTTMDVEGEWGMAERDATIRALEQALARRPECLVLDLSGVTFIDSSGIHVVVIAAKRCAEEDVRIVIIPGPPHVHRVFEICQLTTQLPFAAQV